jgi:hypothetical protein
MNLVPLQSIPGAKINTTCTRQAAIKILTSLEAHSTGYDVFACGQDKQLMILMVSGIVPVVRATVSLDMPSRDIVFIASPVIFDIGLSTLLMRLISLKFIQ